MVLLLLSTGRRIWTGVISSPPIPDRTLGCVVPAIG